MLTKYEVEEEDLEIQKYKTVMLDTHNLLGEVPPITSISFNYEPYAISYNNPDFREFPF